MPTVPTTESFLDVPDSDEPLLLRHAGSSSNADRNPTPVLFIHPGGRDGSVWTTVHDGCDISWFGALADAGFDCWALDIRGYGGSPWGAAGPPSDPFLCSRADQAVFDVDAAADHILQSNGADQIHVIGWGWGALVAALFVGETDLPVASLCMLAPRLAEPNDHPDAIDDWTWVDGDAPVPPGARIDIEDVASGQAVYAPQEIDCPTLLIRAVDDPGSTESDVALLFLLLGTEHKQLWEVPGDHFFPVAPSSAETAARITHWLHSLASSTDE